VRTKIENGIEIALTQAEEIARDAEEKLWAEEQVELAKTQYQRDRKPAYPDIGDQLDDLYHAGMFSAELAAKIKLVKDKFPKE
jgi:hypothetical protein